LKFLVSNNELENEVQMTKLAGAENEAHNTKSVESKKGLLFLIPFKSDLENAQSDS
jgi:hypothetical protein